LFSPHPPLTPALSPQSKRIRQKQVDRVALVIDAYLPQHLGRDAVAARQRTARETAPP
jgi:hypothetical protein